MNTLFENGQSDEACLLLEQASDAGNVEATYSLADDCYLWTSESGSAKGVELLKVAAEAGLPEAQYDLGVAYTFGWHGLEENLEEAFRLFKLSADSGYTDSFYRLGDYYEQPDGGNDPKKAFEYYRMGAEAGDDRAQEELGLCYLNGRGIEENNEEGVKWLELAVSQNNYYAMETLSVVYYVGEKVTQAFDKAFSYAETAYNNGRNYGYAPYVLGMCYYNGFGVTKDLAKAEEYLRESNEFNAIKFVMLNFD